MAIFQFNAANVAPDAGRLVVPADWYVVVVEKSEIVPTKNGAGLRLNMQFGIQEGAYKGQKLFHSFNTKNESVKAMEISYSQLSALMHSVGVLDIQDTSQLHNLPLRVKAKLVPAQMNDAVNPPVELYPEKNEITAFKSMSDPVGAVKAAAPVQQTTVLPPPTQTGTPPTQGGWKPGVPAAAPAAPPATQPASAAPGWNPPATAQPWQQDPNAQAAQAPATAAPVQATTPAPSPAPATAQPSAPAAVVPPWMQQQQ